jgi:sporulation protein YlmC with PRC-barrel domain
MKLFLSLICGCVLVGGLLSLVPDHTALSQQAPKPSHATLLAGATATPMLYLRTLQGMPVRAPDGMPFGTLADLVLDPTDGRIVMVIVVAGGRFGFGGRFIALPWSLVQPVADGTALVVALAPAPLHSPLNEDGPEAIFPQSP